MPLTPAFEASVYKSRRDEVLRRYRHERLANDIAGLYAMLTR